MKIYVVRHGQTSWNVLKKMQGGGIDIPLNDEGIQQAKVLQNKIKNISYDILFCSPLTRAKQTADIINTAQISIQFDDRLKERNYGEFEGVNKNSFSYNDFWAYTKNIHYEKAENVQKFFSRVYQFLDFLKENFKNKTILIVCHAGVMKAIKCYVDGMMDDSEIGPYLPENASVLEYDI